MNINLEINEYQLRAFDYPPRGILDIVLRKRRGIKEKDWLIIQSESYLSKTPDNNGFYHFHYKILPSSHNNNYKFDSAMEAYKFWLESREMIVSNEGAR